MRIFLDMDGVLADFDLGFYQEHGLSPDDYEELHGSKAFWDQIYGSDFFATLPVIPGALKAVALLQELDQDLMILSAPSKTDVAKCTSQKQYWLTKKFGPIPAVFDRDKYRWCKKGDVLIDDRDSNLGPWGEKGGIPVKFNLIPVEEEDRDSKLEMSWCKALVETLT